MDLLVDKLYVGREKVLELKGTIDNSLQWNRQNWANEGGGPVAGGAKRAGAAAGRNGLGAVRESADVKLPAIKGGAKERGAPQRASYEKAEKAAGGGKAGGAKSFAAAGAAVLVSVSPPKQAPQPQPRGAAPAKGGAAAKKGPGGAAAKRGPGGAESSALSLAQQAQAQHALIMQSQGIPPDGYGFPPPPDAWAGQMWNGGQPMGPGVNNGYYDPMHQQQQQQQQQVRGASLGLDLRLRLGKSGA